jgi:hypothetical protein
MGWDVVLGSSKAFTMGFFRGAQGKGTGRLSLYSPGHRRFSFAHGWYSHVTLWDPCTQYQQSQFYGCLLCSVAIRCLCCIRLNLPLCTHVGNVELGKAYAHSHRPWGRSIIRVAQQAIFVLGWVHLRVLHALVGQASSV